ncbi:MAG TPA: FxsA family protein [Aggregicoccus sp.]|nr:FxsA family protein [Aggregicoccus sp.]
MGKLLLLLVLLPLAELYLLLRLGERLGALPVLGLLLLSAVLGLLLARSEGARVLRQVQAALARGQMPDEAMASGALVVVGGALLVLPGVISDAVGLVLLVPPSRRWVAGRLRRAFSGRVVRMGPMGPFGPAGPMDEAGPRVTRPPLRGEVDAEFSEEPRE